MSSSGKPAAGSHFLAGAAAVLVLALITGYRIFLAAHIPDRGSFAKYTSLADRVLASSVPADRLPDVSPGFLWLVVGARGVGAGPGTIAIAQVLLLSLAAAALAAVAWRRAGALAGVVTALVLLGSKAAFVNATEVEPETMVLFWISSLLALVLWPGTESLVQPHGGKTFRDRSTVRICLAGLAAGMAIVTRPSNVLMALLAGAWIVLAAAPRRRSRGLLAYGLAAAAPVLVALSINVSLAGQWTLMNPGTVFYEGLNPLATGYGGVAPRIVNDLERCSRESDFLHVAYRILAARDTGSAPSPELANRYWTRKSLAWAAAYPRSALELIAAKLRASISSYEIWDLITLEIRSRLVSRLAWLPFGFSFALALAGVALRRDRLSLFLLSVAGGGILVMVVFYASARQRNAILPAIALLGGLAAVEIARRFRDGKNGVALVTLASALAATLALSVPTPAAAEHAYLWDARFALDRLRAQAHQAREAGDESRARLLEAAAAISRPDLPAGVDPAALEHVGRTMLGESVDLPRLFDLARALTAADRPALSHPILLTLERRGYEPMRENTGVSSVSYESARALLRLDRRSDALAAIELALHEAPADPFVLALAEAALAGPAREQARSDLRRMHDSFTVELARAAAAADQGPSNARQRISNLSEKLPEGACSQPLWLHRVGAPRLENPH